MADRPYGLGRVAFRKHRDGIKAKLDAGYPMTTVFAEFSDRLGISYKQFARYAGELVERRPRKTKTPLNPTKPPNHTPDQGKPDDRPRSGRFTLTQPTAEVRKRLLGRPDK